MAETQKESCASCGVAGCHGHWKKKASMGFLILAISGSLLLLAMFFSTMKAYKYIGRDISPATTISVSGDGEAYQAPDIAEVSFSITSEGKTPTDARKQVDGAMRAIQDFLKRSGVEDKDIKATYSLYPKYEFRQIAAPICVNYPCPPYPNGKQVLIGYEVTESVDLKIRAIDTAGSIVGGLADKGATNMSGLTFKVDDEDAVKARARDAAIAKAKAKASALAGSLGITLGRIISFNEGGNYPVYYARATGEMKAMSAAAAPTPVIPAGENKYTSNVTIVYEMQ